MTTGFTPDEENAMKFLIREGIRNLDRGRRRLKERFGDEYDPTANDRREELYRSAYKKLGGDPNRIDRPNRNDES